MSSCDRSPHSARNSTPKLVATTRKPCTSAVALLATASSSAASSSSADAAAAPQDDGAHRGTARPRPPRRPPAAAGTAGRRRPPRPGTARRTRPRPRPTPAAAGSGWPAPGWRRRSCPAARPGRSGRTPSRRQRGPRRSARLVRRGDGRREHGLDRPAERAAAAATSSYSGDGVDDLAVEPGDLHPDRRRRRPCTVRVSRSQRVLADPVLAHADRRALGEHDPAHGVGATAGGTSTDSVCAGRPFFIRIGVSQASDAPAASSAASTAGPQPRVEVVDVGLEDAASGRRPGRRPRGSPSTSAQHVRPTSPGRGRRHRCRSPCTRIGGSPPQLRRPTRRAARRRSACRPRRRRRPSRPAPRPRRAARAPRAPGTGSSAVRAAHRALPDGDRRAADRR